MFQEIYKLEKNSTHILTILLPQTYHIFFQAFSMYFNILS